MARASFQKIKLLKKKNTGIVAITAYDARFARYFDDLGFDIILIGDSLGEVIKGQKNTHNVSLENMIYHSQAVSRAVKNSYLISSEFLYNFPEMKKKYQKTFLRYFEVFFI